ncbi:MAG TPA: response regulator [Rhodospirillales bacterium]|nr:response regulator [Rhodospirillales bacterium]
MTRFHYENATVLLAEPNAGVRAELKEALNGMGFGKIVDTGNLKGVQDFFWEEDVHLLIGETTLAEGDLDSLIHQVRHQEFGHSPFVVVVALISDNARAKSAIDAGADDVLLRPFTQENLCARILKLTENRKRFVVTTDYIGPDRREKPRTEGMPAPLVEVPNPLQMGYCGKGGAKALRRAAQAALVRINRHKVERQAFQAHWLVERIAPALKEGRALKEEGGAEMLDRLQIVAKDLNRRVLGSSYAYAAFLCMTLVNTAEKLKESSGRFDLEDARLLDKLSKQILRACSPEQTGYLDDGEDAPDA